MSTAPSDSLTLTPIAAGRFCRIIWEKLRGASGERDMEVFAAGVIAGDAIFSFFDSVSKNFWKR